MIRKLYQLKLPTLVYYKLYIYSTMISPSSSQRSGSQRSGSQRSGSQRGVSQQIGSRQSVSVRSVSPQGSFPPFSPPNSPVKKYTMDGYIPPNRLMSDGSTVSDASRASGASGASEATEFQEIQETYDFIHGAQEFYDYHESQEVPDDYYDETVGPYDELDKYFGPPVDETQKHRIYDRFTFSILSSLAPVCPSCNFRKRKVVFLKDKPVVMKKCYTCHSRCPNYANCGSHRSVVDGRMTKTCRKCVRCPNFSHCGWYRDFNRRSNRYHLKCSVCCFGYDKNAATRWPSPTEKELSTTMANLEYVRLQNKINGYLCNQSEPVRSAIKSFRNQLEQSAYGHLY